MPVPRAEAFATREAFEAARGWRLCIDDAHEGERVMPLDAHHFNVTGGQLVQCRQCKLRYVRARRGA